MNRFDNPAGARLGFYGACTSIGGIVATLIAGPLCDRFGRRALVFVGSGLVIAMAIMETFASSFSIFMAGKLLLGFGGTLSQVTSPVLVVELAHPKSRIAISGIYNTSIYLGEIIGAWITYATFRIHGNWSWKIPCILQCVFPLYEFCTIWFCPESPRWLVSKDRIEEARAILIKYHGNGEETELVKDELREIIAGVNADATEMSFSKSGLRSILGSTGNLHRLWICFWTAVASQCAGSGLIMYYLPDILDQVGISSSKNKTLINGCVDIWSWVIGIIASVTMPYMRRRSILMFCTVGMLFTFIAWTALTAEYLKTGAKAYGVGVVAMIFVFNLFFSFCWLPLVITYPMEVVTTKQRGVFFAFTMFVINASNFVVRPKQSQFISQSAYILLIANRSPTSTQLGSPTFHGDTTSSRLSLSPYYLSSFTLRLLKRTA